MGQFEPAGTAAYEPFDLPERKRKPMTNEPERKSKPMLCHIEMRAGNGSWVRFSAEPMSHTAAKEQIKIIQSTLGVDPDALQIRPLYRLTATKPVLGLKVFAPAWWEREDFIGYLKDKYGQHTDEDFMSCMAIVMRTTKIPPDIAQALYEAANDDEAIIWITRKAPSSY